MGHGWSKSEQTFISLLSKANKDIDRIKSLAKKIKAKLRHESETIVGPNSSWQEDHLNSLDDLGKGLLQSGDSQQFRRKIENCAKFGQYFDDLRFAKESELNNYSDFLCKRSLILPIKSQNDELEFMLVKLKNSLVSEDKLPDDLALHLDGMLEVIWAYNYWQGNISPSDVDDLPWEEIFSALPFPVCLISEDGGPVLHNSRFMDLGLTPKACLALKHGEQTLIKKQIYHIYRQEFFEENLRYIYFVFLETEFSEDFGSSATELGIISSSIAHELNNPLAGILAGLTLLKELFVITQEQEKTLDEMKKSALRCKRLIDTFLGLSRKSTQHDTSKEPVDMAIEQAFDLIRFRAMEANVKLNIKRVSLNGGLGIEVNTSLFAMVFYMVLGELITTSSQYSLIDPIGGRRNNVIEGEFIEDPGKMTLKLALNVDLEGKIKSTKLLRHLLGLQGFELIFKENCIICFNPELIGNSIDGEIYV